MAASAPGKLILFGEHAVVFGEPALSTAVSLRTEVYARPHPEWLADGASLDGPKYRYVKAAVRRSRMENPLWLEIRSMIPTGAGLGPSAAVTVAALGALATLRRAFDPPATAPHAVAVADEAQGGAGPTLPPSATDALAGSTAF